MVSLIFWNKRVNKHTRFPVIIAVAVALLTPAAYGNGRINRYIIDKDERFWGVCSDLTSFTIPDGVTFIGNYAFQNCKNLKSITIPNSVALVYPWAFLPASSLTSIEVAADNAHYSSKDGVLFNKDKTVLVRYPQGRQGAYTIPSSVIKIEHMAFFDCTGLTSITIPNSVDSIRSNAFNGCIGLTSITIPNSVTTIEGNAFARTGLTSITIPSSVTFFEASSLPDTIEVAADNAHYYRSTDGVLFNKDKTILIRYSRGRLQGAYTIPGSVTNIRELAFVRQTGLTSITIPNSVTTIGNHAFSDCTGLTSITIPQNVTSIGWGGFAGCTDLTSIIVKNPTPPELGLRTFDNIDMNNVCLYVPPASVEAYRFKGWGIFKCIKSLESVPQE